MTKFGELISAEEPVLIDFYFDWEDADNNVDTLRDVAAAKVLEPQPSAQWSN